jgi:hypothetical protein
LFAVQCVAFLEAPAAILGIQAAMRDLGGGEVLAEEKTPGLVGQRDALA